MNLPWIRLYKSSTNAIMKGYERRIICLLCFVCSIRTVRRFCIYLKGQRKVISSFKLMQENGLAGTTYVQINFKIYRQDKWIFIDQYQDKE